MHRVKAKSHEVYAKKVLVSDVIYDGNLSPVFLEEVEDVEIYCWH